MLRKLREAIEDKSFYDTDYGNHIISLADIEEALAGIKELKPVIPQFVADYIEGLRYSGLNFYSAYEYAREFKRADGKTREWLNSEENLEDFARAWLDGYTVEKKTQWVVKIGKGFFTGYDDTKVTFTLDNFPGELDRRIVYDDLHEAESDAEDIGGEVVEL